MRPTPSGNAGRSDETAEALRSIVNAGHRRSATVGRVEMNGASRQARPASRCYAPAAIAGIGNLPDTIMDRAVIVRMRRRAPDERIRDYRERTTRPEGDALRDQLANWAASVADWVGDPWPDMPDGVADRPADVWEPLLMVADLAGVTGRSGRAKHARRSSRAHGTTPPAPGPGCSADMREVWPRTGTSRNRRNCPWPVTFRKFRLFRYLGTDDLLHRFHALDEAPWGDWYGHPLNPRQLAKLLKPYSVSSTKVRIGEQSVRGYRSADLHDAWKRYRGSAARGESDPGHADDGEKMGQTI